MGTTHRRYATEGTTPSGPHTKKGRFEGTFLLKKDKSKGRNRKA